MKKVFFIAAVAAAAVFGVMKTTDVNNSNMSDLQLENLELLAEGEPNGYPCPGAALEWKIASASDHWNDKVYAGINCLCKSFVYTEVTHRCE